MENRVELVPGMDVYGSDREKIGSISDVYENSIKISKGFFTSDVEIPLSAIEGVDREDRVFLYVTKGDALDQGWDTTVGTTYAQGTSVNDDRPIRDAVVSADTEATHVPVYEEDLTAVKRQVNRGAVRIEKEIITEDRTMTVPVTEERVRVTRVDADLATPVNAADAFKDGVIEVPIMGEEVDVQKTTQLAGEVIVEKETVERNETVGGTVRREEVRVDDDAVEDLTDINRTRNPRA